MQILTDQKQILQLERIFKKKGLAMFKDYASLAEILEFIHYLIEKSAKGKYLTWQEAKKFFIKEMPAVWENWSALWKQLHAVRYANASLLPFSHNLFFLNADYFAFTFVNSNEGYFYANLLQLLLGKDIIYLLNKPKKDNLEILLKQVDYECILQMQAEKNRLSIQADDRYIKTIRADALDFWHDFILGITKTGSEAQTPTLRRKIKEGYTYSADGIYFLPKNIQKFSEKQMKEKKSLSTPQSVSLLRKTKTTKYFGFARKRQEKLVGISVLASDALANRFLVYDIATHSAPWRNEDLAKVISHANKHLPNLYADINDFKQRIEKEDEDKYNEVLARIRFDEKTSNIVVFSCNFISRCLAQERARTLKNALLERPREQRYYQVPIVFYPNFEVYTEEQQLADKKLANTLFEDEVQLNFLLEEWLKPDGEEELKYDLDFLYLVEDINAIFQKENLLKVLIHSDNLPLFYNLLDRAARSQVAIDLPEFYWEKIFSYMLKREYCKHIPYFLQLIINKPLLERFQFSNYLYNNHPQFLEHYFVYLENACPDKDISFEKNLYQLKKNELTAQELIETCLNLINNEENLAALCSDPKLLSKILSMLVEIKLESSTLAYIEAYSGDNFQKLTLPANLIEPFSKLKLKAENRYFILEALIKNYGFEQLSERGIDIYSPENFEPIFKYCVLNKKEFAKKLIGSNLFTLDIFISLLHFLNENSPRSNLNHNIFLIDLEFVKENFESILKAQINGIYLLSKENYHEFYLLCIRQMHQQNSLSREIQEFILINAHPTFFSLWHFLNFDFFGEILKDIKNCHDRFPAQNLCDLLRWKPDIVPVLEDQKFATVLLEKLSVSYLKPEDCINKTFLFMLNYAEESYIENFLLTLAIKPKDVHLFLQSVQPSILLKCFTLHDFSAFTLKAGEILVLFTVFYKQFDLFKHLIEKLLVYCAVNHSGFYLNDSKQISADFWKLEYKLLYYNACNNLKIRKKIIDDISKELNQMNFEKFSDLIKQQALPYQDLDLQGATIAYHCIKKHLKRARSLFSLEFLQAIDFSYRDQNQIMLFESIVEQLTDDELIRLYTASPKIYWQERQEMLAEVANKYLCQIIKRRTSHPEGLRKLFAIYHFLSPDFRFEITEAPRKDDLMIFMIADQNSFNQKFTACLLLSIFERSFKDDFDALWVTFDKSVSCAFVDDYTRPAEKNWFCALFDCYISYQKNLLEQNYNGFYRRLRGVSIQTEISTAQSIQNYLQGKDVEEVNIKACEQGILNKIVFLMQEHELLPIKLQEMKKITV